MDWSLIEWGKQKIEIANIPVTVLGATIPKLAVNCRRGGIGIDPGRNFAIAGITDGGVINIVYGYLHLDKNWSYAHDGYMAMDLMMAYGANYAYPEDWMVTIEGSAFSKSAGEANLAYIREGFYIGSKRVGFRTKIVPPNKIRLAATGHGRTRMMELLPTMNENGAAALACALFAVGYEATSQ